MMSDFYTALPRPQLKKEQVKHKRSAAVKKTGTVWLVPRSALLMAVIVMALGGVVARAYYLQVMKRDLFQKMAQEQYLKEIEIPARRGMIFDRGGAALAVSNEVQSLFVKPRLVRDPRKAAAQLAKILEMPSAEVFKKLTQEKLFVWLKRRIDPKIAAQVQALGYPFVGAVAESRRFYPNRTLLSHVLGGVNVDERGIEGLEAAYEETMGGESLTLEGLRDARGQMAIVDDLADVKGVQGSDLYLTVDREMQLLASKALAQGVAQVGGKGGIAIVANPKTGEILALANYPEFNPNVINQVPAALRRNRAITDLFEPGSTFKAVTVAAALEEGLVQPDQMIFCENGKYRIGAETIHDVHPMGSIPVHSVIAKSSNIGATKIAMKLGKEKLAHYVGAFGFGAKTGLEIPGEVSGVTHTARRWPLIQLATVSFGQGVSVSALQLAQAYQAIANDGFLVPLRLMKGVRKSDGVYAPAEAPQGRKVISTETAHALTRMLEEVVSKEGTAARAKLEGVRTAGKTATAQKVVQGLKGYAVNKYVANFVGFVPAEAPQLLVAVVVDEPQKGLHFGGVAAAPIFKEIAEGGLRLLGGMPPQGVAVQGVVGQGAVGAPNSPSTVLAQSHSPQSHVVKRRAATADAQSDERDEAQDDFGGSFAAETAALWDQGAAGKRAGKENLPDFHGLTIEEAIALIKREQIWLDADIQGSGRVIAQEPRAGTHIKNLKRVRLVLSSARW